MDWFRWHHGSVTDPKFQLVAKKASASVAEVVAVWAYVLEMASQNTKRGHFDALDCEAIDLALGMDDGTTEAILSVLHDRGMLSEGRVASWDKRQPKREDDTANDRKRRQREREHELALAASSGVTDALSRSVTQCHDESRAVTLEEKRREEKDQEQKHAAASPPPSPADADEMLPANVTRIEPVCRIVLEAYHRHLPNCLPAHTLTPKRQRRILTANKLAKALIARKGLGIGLAEFWDGYFAECAGDEWLRGDVPNPKNPRWRQNIDVLLGEDRFGGIMDAALARDLGSAA